MPQPRILCAAAKRRTIRRAATKTQCGQRNKFFFSLRKGSVESDQVRAHVPTCHSSSPPSSTRQSPGQPQIPPSPLRELAQSPSVCALGSFPAQSLSHLTQVAREDLRRSKSEPSNLSLNLLRPPPPSGQSPSWLTEAPLLALWPQRHHAPMPCTFLGSRWFPRLRPEDKDCI